MESRAGQRVEGLLQRPEEDIFTVEPVFCRADVSAADHGFSGKELAASDQAQGSAAWAGHDGYVGVLGVAQLGLVFKDENRSWVHSFGNPFFKEMQVG
jgi:hypothetical protein